MEQGLRSSLLKYPQMAKSPKPCPRKSTVTLTASQFCHFPSPIPSSFLPQHQHSRSLSLSIESDRYPLNAISPPNLTLTFSITMASKTLNPDAEPFYLWSQKLLALPQHAQPAVVGFPHFGHCHALPPSAYGPCGFGFCPPNHFIQQGTLNARVWRAPRSGLAKRHNKRSNSHQKKKERAEWRVKEAKGKKLPENGGTAGRALIPFPATVEEAEISMTTTVMIRNIPNQLKLDDLMRVLDDHCLQLNKGADPADWSKFDFVYLPMDYRKHAFEGRRSNLGYAFVNFTSPSAAFKFYKRFDGAMWNVPENRKICEVNVAQYQGRESLLRIFSSKLFHCKSHDFLPVVFSEARDGLNRRMKGASVGKHIWGLPRKSIGSSTCFQNQ